MEEENTEEKILQCKKLVTDITSSVPSCISTLDFTGISREFMIQRDGKNKHATRNSTTRSKCR